MKYFHFTLGPVQNFVAQARRTRDFWAGSFILSWLSAVAMKAVEKQGGNILFPKPDPGFMEAIDVGGTGPKQGSVPNRFMAKVEDGFKPEMVVDAVRIAWKGLAEEIWKNDLVSLVDEESETRKIWRRQTNDLPGFWDIEWALVRDKGATNTLDQLKNWRTHLLPDEPGVKCMMMDGWQELSGAACPGDEPKKFWTKVRAQNKCGMETDLRPGEMLCAISFVKRRFVRYFEGVTVIMPSGWTVKGWEIPSAVPSVHYMAVAPWLAQIICEAGKEKAISDALWEFHNAAHKLTGNYSEWNSNIKCIRDTAERGAKKRWTALDGTVFFDAMLENRNLWDKQQQILADDVLGKLKDMRGKAKLGPASPFYAVLMMDGDSLGEQMGEPDKQQYIAEGLAQFTSKAEEIVYAHNGFLVYAGGDDVLALLPLEDALMCAAALRKYYLGCFATTSVATSISAAIEYAHVKMPLGKVLSDAHYLLDDVAKDDRGRDAIACRVWKPGGMTLEWAMPWEIALEDCNVVIELLAEDFQKNQAIEDEQGSFAGKFFYRIGERFDLLNPQRDKDGELLPRILEDEQAIRLMAMEYLDSGSATVNTMDEARGIVKPLLVQCRPTIRKRDGDRITFIPQPMLDRDGALLVRFLANKGVER